MNRASAALEIERYVALFAGLPGIEIAGNCLDRQVRRCGRPYVLRIWWEAKHGSVFSEIQMEKPHARPETEADG